MSFNKVTMIGRLGQDPETRYTPSGTMNVRFSVATSRRYNDREGQQQETTTWFRVTAWDRLAETLDKLSQSGALAKGREVYVEGRLELSEFTGRDGQPRSSLEVRANEFQLVGSRNDNSGGGDGSNFGGGGSRGDSGEGNTGGGNRQQGNADYGDMDDVPF